MSASSPHSDPLVLAQEAIDSWEAARREYNVSDVPREEIIARALLDTSGPMGAWELAQKRAVQVIQLKAKNRRLEEQHAAVIQERDELILAADHWRRFCMDAETRERELKEQSEAERKTLERVLYIAEHLFQMVPQKVWRDSGGDDGQGHWEGDYHAEQVRDELAGYRATLNAGFHDDPGQDIGDKPSGAESGVASGAEPNPAISPEASERTSPDAQGIAGASRSSQGVLDGNVHPGRSETSVPATEPLVTGENLAARVQQAQHLLDKGDEVEIVAWMLGRPVEDVRRVVSAPATGVSDAELLRQVKEHTRPIAESPPAISPKEQT